MKNRNLCRLGAAILTGAMLTAGFGTTVSAEETTEAAQESEAAADTAAQEGETVEDTAAQDGDTAEDTAAANMLEGKYFTYSFSVDTMNFTNFFHFYGEIPGVGHVYYVGLAGNQMNYAGVYEVLEEPHDYSCYEGRESEETTSGTSEYTVVLYDFDGNELYRIGMDEGILYNDTDLGESMGCSPVIYHEDTDTAEGEYADVYAAEAGQKIADFVSPEDATCTVTLYHNGRYADLMELYVEGDWALTETDADGNKTYQLTPDSDTDTAAALVVSADGQSASYTPEGGDTVEMVSNVEDQADTEGDGQSAVFSAETEIGSGEDALPATVTLTANPDYSCSVVLDIYGNTAEIDKGTYSMADDGYTFQFVLDNAGELDSVLDAETYEISLDYAQEGTDAGDVAATLIMQAE